MKKYILLAAILATVVGLLIVVNRADATPLYIAQRTSTASATTSVEYLSFGAGTTTLTYDSYTAGTVSPDRAALAVMFGASSTNSNLIIDTEYSDNGIDWYEDNLNSFGATTSPLTVNVAGKNRLSWVFSSTTPIDGGTGISTSTKMFELRVPERYVRVIFTMATSSLGVANTGGTVWAQIAPIKQRP